MGRPYAAGAPFVQRCSVRIPRELAGTAIQLSLNESTFNLHTANARGLAIQLLRALPKSFVIADQDRAIVRYDADVTVAAALPETVQFTPDLIINLHGTGADSATEHTLFISCGYAHRLAMNILRALSHVPGFEGATAPEIPGTSRAQTNGEAHYPPGSGPNMPTARDVAEGPLTIVQRIELIETAQKTKVDAIRTYALTLLRLDLEREVSLP